MSCIDNLLSRGSEWMSFRGGGGGRGRGRGGGRRGRGGGFSRVDQGPPDTVVGEHFMHSYILPNLEFKPHGVRAFLTQL